MQDHAVASFDPQADRNPDAIRIVRLDGAAAQAAVPALAEVLIDCVEGGASVSFMLPISPATALAFWRGVADAVGRGERVLLVAEDGASGRIVGTVQLILSLPENQPHRADVAKMLVHRTARRRGVAQGLLAAVEVAARGSKRTLLVLDAVTGGAAYRLYSRSGWQRAGDVPGYALMPDGQPCGTTFFYRRLDAA